MTILHSREWAVVCFEMLDDGTFDELPLSRQALLRAYARSILKDKPLAHLRPDCDCDGAIDRPTICPIHQIDHELELRQLRRSRIAS